MPLLTKMFKIRRIQPKKLLLQLEKNGVFCKLALKFTLKTKPKLYKKLNLFPKPNKLQKLKRNLLLTPSKSQLSRLKLKSSKRSKPKQRNRLKLTLKLKSILKLK
jgi:hypothetical protein